MLQFFLVGNQFARLRQQLHQAHGVRARNRERVELRFLANERRNQIGIKPVGHRKSF